MILSHLRGLSSHEGPDQNPAENRRQILLQNTLEFLLCTGLSSLILWSARSSYYWTPSFSSPIKGHFWAVLGFTCLHSGLETLQEGTWGNCRTRFIYFHSVRYHCSSLPNVQCFETIVVFILFFFSSSNSVLTPITSAKTICERIKFVFYFIYLFIF